jgi:hypothetical protein
LTGKAAASHTHAESDVTSLVTDLAAKAAATHTHAESDVTSLVTDLAAKRGKLTPTGTKTANYAAVSGDYVVCDATSGGFTVPLPAAAVGAVLAIYKGDGTSNIVTYTAAGGDTIGIVNPAASGTLVMVGQVVTLFGLSGGWAVESSHKSLSGLDLRYSHDDWLGFAATQLSPGSSRTLAAANASYNRVTRGYARTASKVGFVVFVASGNISVAVYRNTGTGHAAAANNRVATSGAVACPAAGYNELTLDATVDVNPGDWLALTADNATAAFGGTAITGTAIGPLTYRQGAAHPAPSTAGAATAPTSMFELYAIP